MNYHIFNPLSDNASNFHWDVEIDFVKSVVRAYRRGQHEVLIGGRKFPIGMQTLQIFETPTLEGINEVLKDSLHKLRAIQSKEDRQEFFNRTFKNTTDQFLYGGGWGELKEDYYNLYINDGEKKLSILLLTKIELKLFLNEWQLGVDPIWTVGRRVDLQDPKSIKIFDVEYEWLSKDRGKIRIEIKKFANRIYDGSYKPELFEHFGKEVTEQWDVKPYGRSKPKGIGFVWDLIHPDICRVAKDRFGSKQYADAVEASFKELNDVVKKEFVNKTFTEDDGVSLMRQAFKPTKPVFILADLTSESGKGIQDGYMQIFAGSIAGIRNPKAHANLVIDEIDAWEKIVLASHLMKIWDRRI